MNDVEALKITSALEVNTKLWLSANILSIPLWPPEGCCAIFHYNIRALLKILFLSHRPDSEYNPFF